MLLPFNKQVAWCHFEGKKCRGGAGAGGGREGTPRRKSRALAAPCVHFFRPSCALVRSRSRSPAKVHILPYFAVVCADARWRCGQSRHFCLTTSIVEACSAGERAVPRRLGCKRWGHLWVDWAHTRLMAYLRRVGSHRMGRHGPSREFCRTPGMGLDRGNRWLHLQVRVCSRTVVAK